MKKFDTLISNYLYTNKKVDIEGLGTFSLDEHFVLPPDTEKAAFFPLEGIHFDYNSRAETSPELLDYLMQQTGKIKSLIKADFSSYVSEIKQFVNIGKPWVIDGLGTLQKTKEGRFELIPGEALSERISVRYVGDTSEPEKPVRRRKWILGLLFTVAIVAVVAGLGFGIYVLFIKTQNNNSQEQVASTPVDSSNIAAHTDSVSHKPDSVVSVIPTVDSNNFKAIFEVTKWKERVIKRTSQLSLLGVKSYYDSMVIRDTLRYRMYTFEKVLPGDSVKVRDSLSLYFGRKVRLERIK